MPLRAVPHRGGCSSLAALVGGCEATESTEVLAAHAAPGDENRYDPEPAALRCAPQPQPQSRAASAGGRPGGAYARRQALHQLGGAGGDNETPVNRFSLSMQKKQQARGFHADPMADVAASQAARAATQSTVAQLLHPHNNSETRQRLEAQAEATTYASRRQEPLGHSAIPPGVPRLALAATATPSARGLLLTDAATLSANPTFQGFGVSTRSDPNAGVSQAMRADATTAAEGVVTGTGHAIDAAREAVGVVRGRVAHPGQRPRGVTLDSFAFNPDEARFGAKTARARITAADCIHGGATRFSAVEVNDEDSAAPTPTQFTSRGRLDHPASILPSASSSSTAAATRQRQLRGSGDVWMQGPGIGRTAIIPMPVAQQRAAAAAPSVPGRTSDGTVGLSSEQRLGRTVFNDERARSASAAAAVANTVRSTPAAGVRRGGRSDGMRDVLTQAEPPKASAAYEAATARREARSAAYGQEPDAPAFGAPTIRPQHRPVEQLCSPPRLHDSRTYANDAVSARDLLSGGVDQGRVLAAEKLMDKTQMQRIVGRTTDKRRIGDVVATDHSFEETWDYATRGGAETEITLARYLAACSALDRTDGGRPRGNASRGSGGGGGGGGEGPPMVSRVQPVVL